MRHDFTKTTKRDAAKRCKGKCENKKCGVKLRRGGFHYDHINPDYFSGDNSLDNCQVLCLKCHKEKTAGEDIPAIAKTKRILDDNIGIKNESRFKTRKDREKKKLDGTVVDRFTGEQLWPRPSVLEQGNG